MSYSIDPTTITCTQDERDYIMSYAELLDPTNKNNLIDYYNYLCSGTLPPGSTLSPSSPFLLYQPDPNCVLPPKTNQLNNQDIVTTYDFNKFQDVINFSKKFIIDEFIEQLNDNIQDNKFCSSNTIANQTTNLYIPPGTILIGCRVNVNINQTVVVNPSSNLCLNINERLFNMSNENRNNLFNTAINKLKSTLQNNISNKNRFIDLLCTLLVNNINNSPSNATTSCSQDLLIKKTQNVYIEGNIKCNGCGNINIDNDLFAKPYMECIVEPIWTNLENNTVLKRLFLKGDNSNCIYSETQLTACNKDTNKYTSKITIIENAEGTGTCNYVNDQLIEKDCTIPNCEVSNWSNWSPCVLNINNLTNTGTQKRTRKYVKNGEGCEGLQMEEIKECYLSREQLIIANTFAEQNANELKKLNNIKTQNEIYNFIIKGEVNTKLQKTILTLSLLVLVVIFYLIFK